MQMHIFGFAILLLATIQPATATATDDRRDLLSIVQTHYLGQLAAIESVECSYTYQVSSLLRECRYAWDRGRFYHASLDRLSNGAFGMPMEIGWDGQGTHYHAGLRHMAITH